MKLKYITSIVIMAVSLSACELDFQPTSSVSSASLTPADYDALLIGVYNQAQNMSMGLAYVASDNASDNIKSRTAVASIEIDNCNITTANGNVNGWWDAWYRNIAHCNNLITEMANQSETAKTLEVAAHAKLIRVWNYLQIASFWGDAPLLTEITTELVPRSPEVEIWNLMKEDCEYAMIYAPDFTSASWVSKIAAKAMLARVLLISPAGVQDKTRAAALAEEVIADGRFILADDYASIWHAKNSKEMILQWNNISGDSGSPGWFLRSNLVNSVPNPGLGDLGRFEYPLDNSLISAYELGDNRKDASIRHLQTATSETWDCIKLPRYDGADPWPVIRIAEMYLISAEAQGYPAGVARLNDLRIKRGLTALIAGVDITDNNSFIKKVMAERRVEFLCEGQRFYDLRRWYNSGPEGKAAVLELRSYQPGEPVGSRPQASDNMNIADDGHNLLWPITATAIANNPNLLPNNPGY